MFEEFWGVISEGVPIILSVVLIVLMLATFYEIVRFILKKDKRCTLLAVVILAIEIVLFSVVYFLPSLAVILFLLIALLLLLILIVNVNKY